MLEEIKRLLEEQKSLLLMKFDDGVQEAIRTVSGLEARIAEMEKLATPRRVHLAGLEDEKENFSFFKAIWAIKTQNWDNAGFEKEVFENTRKRAMAMGTGSAGGYIVPTIYIADLIELLQADAIVAALGATFLPNLQGSPVQIPRQSAGSTGYWVGENAAITGSDLTLEQLSLTPKKVAALVKLSNSLIKLSNPAAEQLVRRDIASTIALQIDLKALRGTGSASQPTGIASTSNINTLEVSDPDGGTLDWDDLLDMEYKLAEDNALKGRLGYAIHPSLRRKLLKQKVAQFSGDTGGSYIVAPLTESLFQTWLGYPYKMTTQIPITLTKGSGTNLTEVYFGNWAELIIGQWGGMEIALSTETSDAFEKDQTWVRVLQEVDIAVRHPESFCLVNDAASA